ncbi:hypothetical protein ABZP36_004677, partial [Zizania latifolia]
LWLHRRNNACRQRHPKANYRMFRLCRMRDSSCSAIHDASNQDMSTIAPVIATPVIPGESDSTKEVQSSHIQPLALSQSIIQSSASSADTDIAAKQKWVAPVRLRQQYHFHRRQQLLCYS